MFFLRHDAIACNRLQYSVNITLYMHRETKEKCVTCFIMVFSLFWWSATKPTMSLRNACVNLVSCRLDVHGHLFQFSVFVLFCFCQFFWIFRLDYHVEKGSFIFSFPVCIPFISIFLSYYISQTFQYIVEKQ